MKAEYIVIISDGDKEVEVPVTKEVFDFLVEDDRRAMRAQRKKARYIEQFEMTEELIVSRAKKHLTPSSEDVFLKDEMIAEIEKSLEKCNSKEKRRMKLYLDGHSVKDIAEKEGCSKTAVYRSIRNVRRKIINIL